MSGEQVGSPFAGDQLPVIGRDAENTWLYVSTASGDNVWILAARVEPRGSLADVPVVNR